MTLIGPFKAQPFYIGFFYTVNFVFIQLPLLWGWYHQNEGWFGRYISSPNQSSGKSTSHALCANTHSAPAGNA